MWKIKYSKRHYEVTFDDLVLSMIQNYFLTHLIVSTSSWIHGMEIQNEKVVNQIFSHLKMKKKIYYYQ